ncbi:DUF58 domain-containing protein [Natrialbaceae archaeon GCM10025810]|uniref:DUF58 domain-containing protein n=1 Tax=Halovalidus salilacus TaxID=3075124 RepID=UPI0036245675
MHLTRRGWTAIGLVGTLAVLAVVYARPLALAGAALVGAWVLAHQYRFVRDLERTVNALSIEQSPAWTGLRTGEDVPVTLTVRREPDGKTGTDSALTLDIEAGLPVASRADDALSVTLAPADGEAMRTQTVAWPVAGRHAFTPATVTATDGLFRETIATGTTPTVIVEPPAVRTVHVGEGGERFAAAYGAHHAGRTGAGIEPAEVREYHPGDTGSRIDWKATARLMTPYVREYEAETDRQTLLVVDHRASLGVGPRAETKLDYLREVALVIAGSARRLTDPLGLVTVGDEGVTDRIDASSAAGAYRTVRRRLLNLEPTTRVAGDASGVGKQTGPADARHALADLTGGPPDSFAETLRPFYADRRAYRRRIAADPLYGAVRAETSAAPGGRWTVICTDDTRPAEIREAVALARRGGNAVTVLLAPSVLYRAGGLANVERAYDRYVEFEAFRRELARMDDVTALEVGPADRLATVLEAGRSRPRSGVGSRATSTAGRTSGPRTHETAGPGAHSRPPLESVARSRTRKRETDAGGDRA